MDKRNFKELQYKLNYFMKNKLFIFIMLFFQFIYILNTTESRLNFLSFKYPESFSVPQKIDSQNFEIYCTIEYLYRGDWIGGCSREKRIFVNREWEVHGHLNYRDKNGIALIKINLPFCQKDQICFSSEIDFAENFAFREDRVYNIQMEVFPIDFSFIDRIKKIISLKTFHTLEIILDKVIIKWEYSCDDAKKKKSIKKEGIFEFNIGKSYSIKINYE